jgi:predicted RNA-binding protein with PIN domain
MDAAGRATGAPEAGGRVRWLVDGMNVIGSRPDGWWRDRTGAMRSLVRRLDELAAATGEAVTVVFDGRPRDVGTGARVTVGFASHGARDAADDEIVRRVEEDPDPGALRVVTSDGELAARVRAHGAQVLPAGGFRRRIEDLGSAGPAA